MRVYVPCDAAALAVGADRVASEIRAVAQARGIEVEIIRNGSRGMFWLEPLVEVETREGRVGYGAVRAADVLGLFDAGFLEGRPHPKSVGFVEQFPILCQTEPTYICTLR